MNMNPALLFDMVRATLPETLHRNVLIVGSLAAAYYHRARLTDQVVATKDADVIVHPAGAVRECVEIAQILLAADWRRTEQCYAQRNREPASSLRAIRLHPRNTEAFFIELLGLPQPNQDETRTWVPCELDDGWYGIPCFRFMALLTSDRRDTELGIQHGSPPLMALANLLSHPVIGTARMQGDIEGRSILRSAKDLGRVLALAWLEPGGVESWLSVWTEALMAHFHDDARALAAGAGAGLRQLLDDEGVMEEAHFTTSVGLLRGHNVTVDQLKIAGDRFWVDLIQPLADWSSTT